MDLPARSFDLARPGVAPPLPEFCTRELGITKRDRTERNKHIKKDKQKNKQIYKRRQ